MIFQTILLISGIVLFALLWWAYRKSVKPVADQNIPDAGIKKALREKVSFYDSLSPDDKKDFLERVKYFISKVRITPVQGVVLTEVDKVLIAAAGIIPLFRFKNWFYNNLNEVLVYPGSFNRDFELGATAERDVIGMVGDGAIHRTMILSLPELRSGFKDESRQNTAIH